MKLSAIFPFSFSFFVATAATTVVVRARRGIFIVVAIRLYNGRCSMRGERERVKRWFLADNIRN